MKAQEYEEGRDWQTYAERTANYAFGGAGDIALREYETYHEYWHRIEHNNTREEQRQKEEKQYTAPRMRM